MEDNKRRRAFLLLVVFTAPFYAQGDEGTEKKSCTDSDGKEITHGTLFIPNYEEPCQKCICDNGYTTLCRMTACSPPPDCEGRKALPRECCKFDCRVNNSQPPSVQHNTTVDGNATAEEDNITNLSLRLVASTVTSFLVLALLLFMVHRLRQRRLMMAMRRFEAQARQQRGDEDDVDHYIPAAFLHIECPPYEDPPPPYSPPKPPHILPTDAPPPYEELENDSTTDLDANGNVNNNNNNNDNRSCQQPGQQPRSAGGDEERRTSYQNARLLEASEALNSSSEGSSLDSCSQGTVGGRTSASLQGREEETEMKLISRRQSHPYDRNAVPFHQDYSLFTTVTSNNAGNGVCEQTGPVMCNNLETSVSQAGKGSGNTDISAGQTGRQRSSEGGSRGGGRGSRRTGRSCSFSFTRSPEEDATMSGVTLGPMSHSYHAATNNTTTTTTADSGVQTHGSYTASLSRHRARAGDKKRIDEGEVERGGEQRMVTKPMVKCDASLQHSHRLLQEELRRNLPRPATAVRDSPQHGAGPVNSSVSGQPVHSLPHDINTSFGGQHSAGHPVNSSVSNSHSSGSSANSSFSQQNFQPGQPANGERSGSVHIDSKVSLPNPVHSNMFSDSQAGLSISHSEPGSGCGVGASLPRSQSITSTFSVCSETGEVHVKKAAATSNGPILQSDSQYPEQHVPKTSPSTPHHLSNPIQQLITDHPTSLPDYTFPSHATLLPMVEGVACGVGADVPASRGKITTTPTTLSRRPVPNPPSQELRTVAAPPVARSQSAKPKHKKIHFVPLEKSKTFKAKKEKGKGGKKGEADTSHRRHDSASRTNSCGTPHVAGTEESGQLPRAHQPKLADVMRGRMGANAPSVKQYGFLDHFPPTAIEEGYPDSRNLDVSKEWRGDGGGGGGVGVGVGARPMSTPHHSLPHKAQAHNWAPTNHPAGHRRHLSHGDKPHPSASTNRLKNKSRPLSSGLVVEPGRDPSDPATALPHSSLARRRAKTLHLKKSRQSYPAPEGGPTVERKAMCVDMGFIEPSPDSSRTVCAGGDVAPFPLPPKRRAMDRGCDKVGLTGDHTGILEGRMSSYV